MSENQDEKILSLLFAVFRTVKEKLNKERNPSVMTLSLIQIEILHYINQNQETAIKTLAKYLHITPPSVTVAVNNLVRLSLAKRTGDKKDRRLTYINLTTKGKKILDSKHKMKNEFIKKILSSLTQKEKKYYIKILTKVLSVA